jgi:hypothetical protein
MELLYPRHPMEPDGGPPAKMMKTDDEHFGHIPTKVERDGFATMIRAFTNHPQFRAAMAGDDEAKTQWLQAMLNEHKDDNDEHVMSIRAAANSLLKSHVHTPAKISAAPAPAPAALAAPAPAPAAAAAAGAVRKPCC